MQQVKPSSLSHSSPQSVSKSFRVMFAPNPLAKISSCGAFLFQISLSFFLADIGNSETKNLLLSLPDRLDLVQRDCYLLICFLPGNSSLTGNRRSNLSPSNCKRNRRLSSYSTPRLWRDFSRSSNSRLSSSASRRRLSCSSVYFFLRHWSVIVKRSNKSMVAVV